VARCRTRLRIDRNVRKEFTADPFDGGRTLFEGEPVQADLAADGLQIVGNGVVSAVQAGPGPGHGAQGKGTPGGKAVDEETAFAGKSDGVLQVVEHRLAEMHRVDLLHYFQNLLRHHQGGSLLPARFAMALEYASFRRFVGVADTERTDETVELGVGQREGADLFMGVLGGDDEKRFVERMALAVDRDVVLLHRLKQGGLGLWHGAVDFVGQQELRENGSLFQDEFSALLVEIADAEDVGGQQVAGELDTAETEAKYFGKALGEGSFADAGNVFEQDMTAREKSGQRKGDRVPLSDQAAFDGVDDGNKSQVNGCIHREIIAHAKRRQTKQYRTERQ